MFLVDTGFDISVHPKSYGKFDNISSKYKLFAANCPSINTYGQHLIVLDLGLRRIISWPYIVADVTKPIIGADFLVNFGLLVDLKTKNYVIQ